MTLRICHRSRFLWTLFTENVAESAIFGRTDLVRVSYEAVAQPLNVTAYPILKEKIPLSVSTLVHLLLGHASHIERPSRVFGKQKGFFLQREFFRKRSSSYFI